MTFLELAKALRREADIPGTGPTTVVDQTGQLGDLVAWLIDTWRDMQTEHGGRWKWLRREFTLTTVASTRTYAYDNAAIVDTDTTAAITRFNRWQVNDEEDPPRIYKSSAGIGTQRYLSYLDWKTFGLPYRTGTQTEGPPSSITVDDRDRINLGQTPDDVYVVTGNYWRGPQILALDEDEPECPPQFHMAIVWEALIRHGLSTASKEALTKAEVIGRPLVGSLERHQGAWMNWRLGAPFA